MQNPIPSDLSLVDRRRFLQLTGGGLALALATRASASLTAAEPNRVTLSPLSAVETEAKEQTPSPSLPPSQRVGFAVVGLGRIAMDRFLPGLTKCKYAKPVALVSGNRDKALKVARQYGIRETAIYDYQTFDQLIDNPEVKAVYIALPNSLHAEYTLRAAKARKHVLCEKPMATSVTDGQQMIEACKTANVKLMIGYRSQYEPLDRAIMKMVKEQKFGELREFIATNSQNQGDPSQWRLNRKLAGGGPVPDVGIYCFNAARFLSGEEPTEVSATLLELPNDPRFKEVEAAAQFTLRFPSGFLATCSCSYASHRSQFLRLQGSKGWAELDPAFAYTGLKMRYRLLEEKQDTAFEPSIEAKDQFTEETDHLAQCILNDKKPHTPGEEGLQDQKITDAIYESGRSGRSVKLPPPPAPTRGSDLEEEN